MRSYEFEQYFNNRTKELGLSITQIHKQTGLSRQAIYDLKKGITAQAKVSTVITIAHVLKTHPTILFQLLLNQIEFPKRSIEGAKYSCDSAGFIADVTIPDNTLVSINQVFTKVWTIQNNGHVTWQGRQLICVDIPVDNLPEVDKCIAPKEQRGLLPSHRVIDIAETKPNGIVQLSVEFTAPPYQCSVFSYWKMIDAEGDFCFPQSEGLSCHVQVMGL